MSQNTSIKDTAWHEDATSPATQADYRELQAHYDQLQTELLNWRKKSASQAVQIETLAKEVDSANDRAGAIADERDALAAQVEALQSRIVVAERVEAIFNQTPDLSFDDCVKLFPDHLRELRAEVVKQYVAKLMNSVNPMSRPYLEGICDAVTDQFMADSIRQGGAE